MLVADLMTRDVVAVDAHATARDAAHYMREKNVGSVLVTDQGRLVGLVTDRQVVVHVVGRDLDAKEVPVTDIMTHRPVCVREGDSIFDAATLCLRSGPFRRMPVLDNAGGLVGILSIADMALAVHPLLEAVLAETEASVREAKVEELGLKKEIAEHLPRVAR